MPELPEVETIRRQLEPRLFGRHVRESGSHPSAKFLPAREVIDVQLGRIGRRGKYLLIDIAGGRELVVHLGMTGRLSIQHGEPDLDNPYLRAWWMLDGRETLEFSDVRRFGRLRVVPAGDHSSIPTLAHAGPEPWDPELTPRRFHQLLGQSRRPIKTRLLSQRPIAGVGNIYADEALWLSGINPMVTRISRHRAALLLDALRDVLSQGIENGGTTLRDYRNLDGAEGSNQRTLAAYGRGGQECRRCGAVLRSRVIDTRTSTWCPECQR